MFRLVAWQQGGLGALVLSDESTVRAVVLLSFAASQARARGGAPDDLESRRPRWIRSATEQNSQGSSWPAVGLGGGGGGGAVGSRTVGASERRFKPTLGGANEAAAVWAPRKVWIGPTGLGMCCEVRQ